ncbi:hypothetical protein CBS101457_004969 [Exobasidium rhododendri]|nr:hypothetical protein CBS101457_004969 [Exobasidium rhododendri]
MLYKSQVLCLLVLVIVAITLAPQQADALAMRSDSLSLALPRSSLRSRQSDDDDDDDDDDDNGAADTEGQIGYGGGEEAQQGDEPQGSCPGVYSLDGTCDPEGNDGPDVYDTSTYAAEVSTTAAYSYTATSPAASSTSTSTIPALFPAVTTSSSSSASHLDLVCSKWTAGGAAVLMGILVTLL